MGWQPIETAPRGRPLFDENGPYVLLGWTNRLDMTIARFERRHWRDGYGGAVLEPTHWMPLPEPPMSAET